MSKVWKLITPPSGLPVTRAEAKAHCNVPAAFTADDALFDVYLSAATEYLSFANRAWLTQTVDVYLEEFPDGDCIKLPLGTLQSVSAFEWVTSGDVTRSWTVSGSNLLENGIARAHINTVDEPAEIELAYSQSWPTDTLKTSLPIRIRIVCGYGNASAVPVRVKQSILLLVAHWYENRSAVVLGNASAVVSKALEIGVNALMADLVLRGALED